MLYIYLAKRNTSLCQWYL